MRFDARGTKKHVVFGHSHIVQKAGTNRILLAHRYPMPIEPSSHTKRIACRLEAMRCDIAIPAMVGNVFCFGKPLGRDYVSSELIQIFVERIVHKSKSISLHTIEAVSTYLVYIRGANSLKRRLPNFAVATGSV